MKTSTKKQHRRYSPLHAFNRRQACKAFPDIGVCEGCKIKPAQDRHHIDGDTSNNHRGNLLFLCKQCHQKEHHPISTFDSLRAMQLEAEFYSSSAHFLDA